MTQTEHVLAEEEQMSAARTKHQEETYRECIPTFFSFFPSHLLSSPFYSLSLLLIVLAQIRGHIAGSSPPLPTMVRALHFYREKI